MSETNGVPTSAAPADAPEAPEAVAARLTGRVPTPRERAEAAFYGGLRPVLLAARDDAVLSQSDLAQRLEMGQSEVSRLETSVGPRTRLGRIRDYLAGCGARLAVVVSTATGRTFTIAEAEGDLAAASREPVGASMAPAAGSCWFDQEEGAQGFVVGRLAARAGTNVPGANVPGANVLGTNIQGHVPGGSASVREDTLIEHILALDEAMAVVGLPPDRATRVRHAFLTRLRPGRPAWPSMSPPAPGQRWPGDATATEPGQGAAEQDPYPLQRG